MQQALHIFRKDVRHLWPEISFAVTLAGVLAVTSARQMMDGVSGSLIVNLLPLAWAVLIARVIYDEPLPGDSHFWLTRPYSRSSLLAAKALFVAAFVNLPKLISDMVVLQVHGFSITGELGGLLWTQVLLTGIFILPIAAVCAVTTGIVQLLIIAFAVGLSVIGSDTLVRTFDIGIPWLALEWTRLYVAGLIIAAAALTIVAWQYARRLTTRSRVLAGAAIVSASLVLLLFPWKAAFALQSQLSRRSVDTSKLHVGYDSQMSWAVRALINRDKTVELQFPLRITGIPDQMEVVAEGISASMEGPSGEVWRSGGEPRRYIRTADRSTSFFTIVDSPVYERIRMKNQPLRIRGSLYLTLCGNRRHRMLPIRDRSVFEQTPGVGLCAAMRTGVGIMMSCRSAFRSKPDIVTFSFLAKPRVLGASTEVFYSMEYPQAVSYSPFPADPNLIPVSGQIQTGPMNSEVLGVKVVALEPVAHLRRDFDIRDVHFGEHEARQE